MVPEVANFMAMYPAYRFIDLVEEYATTFYALLSEGYRIRNKYYRTLAAISDLPNAPQEAKDEFYRNLEYASMQPGDILKPKGTYSSPSDIKKMLGG